MKNFIFISPEFPANYYNFCDRLKKNGINVLGISSTAYDNLRPELRNCLTEYYKVDDLNNYSSIVKAVGYFTYKYGKIDWVESNNKDYLTLDAKIRKDFNITTGKNADEIDCYISRSAMKECYRQARIPSPRYAIVTTLSKAKAFVERVGYPLVVKPDDTSKSYENYEIHNDEQLEYFFNNLPTDGTYIMEELINGNIITYDGICDSNGEVLVEASHIAPAILNVINNSDISYYTNIKVSNRLSSIGKKAIKAFGTKSKFFHLEFIKLEETKRGLGKAGRYVALESDMRPAGGYTSDMINYANSFDIYQLWADMIAFDELRHSYNGEKHYCVSASRRDNKNYIHSKEEIIKQYGKYIVMNERLPEAFSSSMGNEMYTAKVETMKQLESFIDFVLQKQ